MVIMETKNRLPIDRGWAWVITFSTLGLFAFIAGSFKSQGVILVELQELFPDHSPKSILWVFSLSSLLNKCLGPVNGLLLAKTSNRFLACCGVGIMTVSLVSFAYSPLIEIMYFTYGVLYGVGVGMVSLSVYTAYNGYFDKWKALSIGLTTAGSGIGTIIIPILLRLLFDNYSFSGAILLYGAVALQLMVLASLLRPMSYYEAIADWKSRQQIKEGCKVESEGGLMNNNDADGLQDVDDDIRARSVSVGAKHQLLLPLDTSEQTCMFLSAPHGINHLSANVRYRHSNSKHSINKSVRELASIQDISGGSGMLFDGKADIIVEDDSSNSDEEPSKLSSEKKKKPGYNWRLALEPNCILLGMVMLLYTCGLGVAYQCIPPLGKSAGVSKTLIATLFTAAGSTEIPCRIFNGWLADRGFISALNQLGVCMMATGIFAFVCATVSSTAGITVMIIGLSSTGTSVFSLVPIASSELLGKSNVPTAVGLNFFYQGIGTIISAFSAGAVYEATERWESVYYYISACCFCASTLVFITSVTLRFRGKCKSQNDSKDNTILATVKI